ncbi:MAG: hypothetical protein AAF490_16915 [Chloroflexota bacterium]
MPKQIEKWYSRLTRTGRILLYAAIVGLVWLIFRLLDAIFGFLPELNQALNITFLVLNIIAILLITFVVAQASAIIYMMNQEGEMYREMMTKGRRGGNQLEQLGGRRDQGSMSRRGAKNMRVASAGHLSVDNINQKYPARWYRQATVIEDWKEIQEAGTYALSADKKKKVEIIDATEVGGGYLIGTWDGRFVKWQRNLVLNKKKGRPQSYSTLRNAKKQLPKLL